MAAGVIEIWVGGGSWAGVILLGGVMCLNLLIAFGIYSMDWGVPRTPDKNWECCDPNDCESPNCCCFISGTKY